MAVARHYLLLKLTLFGISGKKKKGLFPPEEYTETIKKS
jgi:hypothetical protein